VSFVRIFGSAHEMRNEMLVVISMKSEHLRRRVSSTTIDSSTDRSKSRLLCVVVVNEPLRMSGTKNNDKKFHAHKL